MSEAATDEATASGSAPETAEQRLDAKIREAFDILDDAQNEHVAGPGKRLVGVVVLFSGGNDSSVLAHLMRERATHFTHANTGIGIEQTRQYVRDVSAAWGVELIEHQPIERDSYRTHVLAHGFPGPAMHGRMFQRLKERQLERTRNDLVEVPRRDRVVFIAGRRASESARRTTRWKTGELLAHERKGSIVWCSPLLNWSDDDMAAYRRRFPDCPRNEVSDMLHMSGECLCGAFAKPGELDEVGFFFPEVKAEIEALQVEVRRAGHAEPKCRWGWGATEKLPKIRKGSGTAAGLCDSCELWRLDESVGATEKPAA